MRDFPSNSIFISGGGGGEMAIFYIVCSNMQSSCQTKPLRYHQDILIFNQRVLLNILPQGDWAMMSMFIV